MRPVPFDLSVRRRNCQSVLVVIVSSSPSTGGRFDPGSSGTPAPASAVDAGGARDVGTDGLSSSLLQPAKTTRSGTATKPARTDVHRVRSEYGVQVTIGCSSLELLLREFPVVG